MRLEPSHHPLPGDRPRALVAQGAAASLTNPLLRWPGRLRRTAWLLVAGLVPVALGGSWPGAGSPTAPDPQAAGSATGGFSGGEETGATSSTVAAARGRSSPPITWPTVRASVTRSPHGDQFSM